MTAKKLGTKHIEKPWGRHRLWPGFADPAPGDSPVGEIWFDVGAGDAPELLIKYLFTSEKLSVQVHPDDAAAKAAGYPCGKDEAWIILAAAPGATIALGTRRPLDRDQLRAAALDGSIEQLLDWHPVQAGDFLYSPAGTIHAIGAGITLVEVQQNVDLTYRLYDYGRPRDLHLDAAVAVAVAAPFAAQGSPSEIAPGRTLLVEGPKFTVERWAAPNRSVSLPADQTGWLVPIAGTGTAGATSWQAGECLMLTGDVAIASSTDADLLLAYPGDRRI